LEGVSEGIREASADTSEATPRKLGKRGRERFLRETGIILAGLLAAGREGSYVSIQRRPGGEMWKNGQPLGNRAFLNKLGLLKDLGLVQEVEAIKFPSHFGTFDGKATRLRPTAALLALAKAHGCTSDSRGDDWPILYAPPSPPEIPQDDLISFRDWPAVTRQNTISKAARPRLPGMRYDALRTGMALLNQRCDGLTVTGCARPRFFRSYGPGILFGGRCHATGGSESFQTMSKAQRSAITINGEAVAEVDLKAAALSIFLAGSGALLPSGDPYALEGIDRATAKEFFMQSLYAGRLKSRWASDIKAPNVPLRVVKAAALARYPTLADLSQFYQREALTLPSRSLAAWASGQMILAIEAQIISRATELVWDAGGVAWPMHDALLVPRSSVERARLILTETFRQRLGQQPQVEVTGR